MKIPSFNTIATTNLVLVVIAVLLAAAIPALRVTSTAQAQQNDQPYTGNVVATRDLAVSASNDRIAAAIERVAEANMNIAKSNGDIAKAILSLAKAWDSKVNTNAGKQTGNNAAPGTNPSGIEVEVGKTN